MEYCRRDQVQPEPEPEPEPQPQVPVRYLISKYKIEITLFLFFRPTPFAYNLQRPESAKTIPQLGSTTMKRWLVPRLATAAAVVTAIGLSPVISVNANVASLRELVSPK